MEIEWKMATQLPSSAHEPKEGDEENHWLIDAAQLAKLP